MIKFNWKKSGIIFSKRNIPFKNFHSRAMLPRAIILKDKIRVFYTFINKNKNANFSFFDLDLHNPNNIIYIHKKKYWIWDYLDFLMIVELCAQQFLK